VARLVIAAYRAAKETKRIGGRDPRLTEIIYHRPFYQLRTNATG